MTQKETDQAVFEKSSLSDASEVSQKARIVEITFSLRERFAEFDLSPFYPPDDPYGNLGDEFMVGSRAFREKEAAHQQWWADVRQATRKLDILASTLETAGWVCIRRLPEAARDATCTVVPPAKVEAYMLIAEDAYGVLTMIADEIAIALDVEVAWVLLDPASSKASPIVDQAYRRYVENACNLTKLPDQSQWRETAARSKAEVEADYDRWVSVGFLPEIYRSAISAHLRDPGKWLFDGLLPRGTVTLLVGAFGTGKSTLATEAAIAAAAPDHHVFLGRRANSDGSGVVAILSGEDSEDILGERIRRLDPDNQAVRLCRFFGGGEGGLNRHLDMLRRVPRIDMLLVDPARSYLVGDEDASGPVSSLFDALNAFASEKNCAVLLVHHLGKNAQVRSLTDVKAMIRGSSVFLDRPRLILGAYRANDTTVIGTLKSSFPTGTEVLEKEVYRWDPVALRLLSADGESEQISIGRDALNDADLKAVMSVIRQQNSARRAIYRTGPNGLFKFGAPELGHLRRADLDQTVAALIAKGAVAVQRDGLHVAADTVSGNAADE